MGERNRYQRIFLIFNQEDSGFGAGQEPSGYAKIEILDNKGKLSVYIQNLKDEPSKLAYKVYMLKCDDKQVKPAFAGNLSVKNNKGELLWEFEPENVGKTGVRIEEFNAAVVLAKYRDRGETSIICPLAAYKKGKVNWREKLDKALKDEKHRDADDEIQDKADLSGKDVYSKYTGGVESKYHPDTDSGEAVNEKSKVIEVSFGKKDKSQTSGTQTDSTLTTGMEKDNANIEKEEAGEKKIDYEIENDKTRAEDKIKPEDKSAEDTSDDFEDMKEYEKMIETNINTPCEDCKIEHAKEETAKKPNGLSGLDRLKRDMDKYFEIYTPFVTRRRDYKWWKINSPVHLNNILYQCNIKTPLLFNPKVMMAHFKYRYLIVGIFSDRIRRREYIVCGVPGVYGVDDRAFGDACRWVQVEGSRPKYGAFGYWIIYIDPKSGKFLNAN